jgi:hypothetical protein
MPTYDETRQEIEVIRTETVKNANSAERVGAAMGHIADRILKDARQQLYWLRAGPVQRMPMLLMELPKAVWCLPLPIQPRTITITPTVLLA